MYHSLKYEDGKWRAVTSDDYLGINEGNLCIKADLATSSYSPPERHKNRVNQEKRRIIPDLNGMRDCSYRKKIPANYKLDHGGRLSAALVLKNAPMKTITLQKFLQVGVRGLTILIIWPI